MHVDFKGSSYSRICCTAANLVVIKMCTNLRRTYVALLTVLRDTCIVRWLVSYFVNPQMRLTISDPLNTATLRFVTCPYATIRARRWPRIHLCLKQKFKKGWMCAEIWYNIWLLEVSGKLPSVSFHGRVGRHLPLTSFCRFWNFHQKTAVIKNWQKPSLNFITL